MLYTTQSPLVWFLLFLVAALIGAIIHWLLEKFFWRKKVNCCDEVEAKLRDREAEIANLNTRIVNIEGSSTNFAARESDLLGQIKSKGGELAAAVAGGVALQKTIDALTGDKNRHERELADLRAQNAKLQGDLKLASEGRTKAEGDLKLRLGEIAAAATGGAVLQKTIDGLTGDKKTLEADLANARAQAARMQADLKASNDNRLRLEGDLKLATDGRNKAEGDLKTKLGEIAAAAAGGAALKATIDKLTGDKGSVEKDLAAANARIAKLETDIRAAGDEKGRYEASLRTRDNEGVDLRGRIAKLEADLNAARAGQARTEGDLKSKLTELAAAAAGGVALKGTIDALSGDKGRLEKELADNKAHVARLQMEAKTAHDASTRAEAMLRAREAELMNAQSQIGALRNDLSAARASANVSDASKSGSGLLGKIGAAVAGAAAGAAITSAAAGSDAKDKAGSGVASFAAAGVAGISKAGSIANLPAGYQVTSTACPQPLADVHGIGSVLSNRLYEAGVGTFWELANLDDAGMKKALRIAEDSLHQPDYAGIRADSLRLAKETNSVGRTWSGNPPDDFEPLQGIGKAFEKRLYDAGICTYEALSSTSIARLKEIIIGNRNVVNEPDFQSWIEQAKKRISR
ncbi:MAG: hypothetical protein KIH69_013875 [Anaerolineae bacterium]|nr:hypothetical protein [Anaerolineae bacterium]